MVQRNAFEGPRLRGWAGSWRAPLLAARAGLAIEGVLGLQRELSFERLATEVSNIRGLHPLGFEFGKGFAEFHRHFILP